MKNSKMNRKQDTKAASKLDTAAKTLKENGEKALVIYLVAGYPDMDTFVDLLHTVAGAGCDIIEIGVPFSDPIADGPVLQEASQRALALGTDLDDVIGVSKRISAGIDTPLVLMSYVNPILQFGAARLSRIASSAGVSGVILPDVPFEESNNFREQFSTNNITYIDLIAPTSGKNRIARIAGTAHGFLYIVSVAGVTGTRSALPRGLDLLTGSVRDITEVPIYVGFGISGPEQARKVGNFSDGIIMGSAIIERIKSSSSRAASVAGVSQLVREVKDAVNG